MEQTPFPVALAQLAEQKPDAPAITDAQGTLTRRELERRSNQLARAFEQRGVKQGDLVSICLPSDHRFLIAAWAVWKLGATPQPLSSRIAPGELEEVLVVSQPALVVGPDLGTGVRTWDIDTDVSSYDASPLPVRVSPSFKAPTSGGSTGRPKVILSTSPAVAEPLVGLGSLLRFRTEDVFLAPAPLHHNGPFLSSTIALLMGAHVVLMERFDPVRALELIEEHRVGWIYAVPTIMSRIAKLPPEVVDNADLSSVHTLFHMAAPCADWLKHWWIDRLGPEAVWELYAGTEVQAITVISGKEWLERPGSVGRTLVGEIKVLRQDGTEAAPDEVGEIWMKVDPDKPTYRYLGGEAKAREGWESLGDLGRLDADGYLYLADRLTDMVLVGGANVYPAEVEAALESHPRVASSCVIGLPDDDLGNRLHAIIQTSGPVTDDDLHAYLVGRLAPYKRPRTIERVDDPLRDEAGKVRRSALRAARLTT